MNTQAIVFGLNCAIASMLALFVAFSFDLANPSWAVLTVFITSQPMVQGAVWGKALYRVVGTVVAMAVALIAIPNLVDAPELLILALAAWLGLCVYLSLLDRSPRSYAFLLSGYTAILVVLPIIAADPGTIFDTAIARTEEILIGVGAAALVHGLVSSHSARTALHGKLEQTLIDARSWVAHAMDASASTDERRARRRLASDVTELATLSMALRFELPEMQVRLGVVRALEDRLVALLPLLSAVESRRETLQELGPLDHRIATVLQDTSKWVQSTVPAPAAFDSLIQRYAELTPLVDEASPPRALLELNLLHRVAMLASAWRDCVDLASAVRDPHVALDARLSALVSGHAPRKLHVDHGIALRSALVAALAVCASASIGFLLEWPPAINAVGLSAVFTSLFAGLDDPTAPQTRFIAWTLLATLLSAVYVFGILAAVDDFAGLALCLFPLYAALGYFMARPSTALQSLSLAISSTTLIALQPAYRADLVSFATVAIAVNIGAIVALELTLFLRVLSADVATRRLLRHGWADLAALSRRPLRQTVAQFAMRMLDRLSLLTPRAGRATSTSELRASDVLRDLQIGFNLSELASVAAQLPGTTPSVRSLGVRLGDYFEALSLGDSKSNRIAPGAVDQVTQELLALPRSEARDRGVAAAVGLRQNLVSFERQAAAAEAVP